MIQNSYKTNKTHLDQVLLLGWKAQPTYSIRQFMKSVAHLIRKG